MENYEQKYKDAISAMEEFYERAKYASSGEAREACLAIERAFPELKESEERFNLDTWLQDKSRKVV